MNQLTVINHMVYLGFQIKEAEQRLFESVGSNMDEYNKWLTKSKWEYHKYLEMIDQTIKNREKDK